MVITALYIHHGVIEGLADGFLVPDIHDQDPET